MFWSLVYRWVNVIAFFRSVRVSVVNMCFLALGSMVGVLFQQEDVNSPIPAGGVDELVAIAEAGGDYADSPSNRAKWAYRHFEGFREAQTFFIYHLANNIGMRSLLGFEGESAGNEEQIQSMLSNLEARLPELAARFGQEKAVAIRSQSETGLRTRAKNAEIRILEQRFNDSMFSLFVIADRLDLRRAYRSDWFSMMWVILFFGLLSSLLRNGFSYLLKKNKWGFALTHIGMLLIIVGGLLGRATEIRGLVNLNIGSHTDRYQTWTRKPMSFVYNPVFADENSKSFTIKLEDFRADQHDVLDVVYVKSDSDGQWRQEFELDEQPRLRVFEGLTHSYDYPIDNLNGKPAFELEVLEYSPQTKVERDVETGSILSYKALTNANFFNPAPATIKLKVSGPTEEGDLRSEEYFLHAEGDGDGVPFSYFAPDGVQRIVWLRFREDRSGSQ
ncbi:MAG: cytochrome c biogenesis protein ResB, partial [Planctomycetota bacterium]|nr:cytochrome c biogenesis protein ResB [Planctomycetota bacterium]